MKPAISCATAIPLTCPGVATTENWSFRVFDPPRKTLPREVGNFGLRGSVSARLAGRLRLM